MKSVPKFWEDVDAAQVTGHLYALIQMIELPSEQPVITNDVNAITQEASEPAPEQVADPEDDIAPF